MTAAETCLRHAEHWFECEEGPAAECDETGKAYFRLLSGGPSVQTDDGTLSVPALYRTDWLAVHAWIRALDEFADDFAPFVPGKKRRLIWRVKPELNETIRYRDGIAALGESQFVPETWYTIYSRLLFQAAKEPV